MNSFPHFYSVNVKAGSDTKLSVSAANLPSLVVAPPLQFDGPGDSWSPEDLLMASVSSCFVLSFRAIARASHFDWLAIECDSRGELDKDNKVTRFIRIVNSVKLTIDSAADTDRARSLLDKAERFCLISNTLNSDTVLDVQLIVQNT